LPALEDELASLDKQIAAERSRLGLDDKSKDEKTMLDIAKSRFNENPKKGVEYLIEVGYFAQGGTASEIAQYLFEGETHGLSKAAIGEYMGEHKPLNLDVLKEFVKKHSFDGMDFDAALRNSLWSFRLPGESQKIDRMMESFAQRFCECNPHTFKTTDGATSSHSPQSCSTPPSTTRPSPARPPSTSSSP
jgi:cytohesin